MTLPISASTHAIAKNLVLFLMFYGSGNSFKLLYCFMGHVIHSKNCQMRGLDGWPWNSRSHDFAHDLTCLSFYTCYSNKFGFVSNVLRVSEFIPPTRICVTLTDDLEIQGHVILHIILPISASTPAIATHLVLFLMFYGSGSSFHLLPYASLWRLTLKFKITWFCTWFYLFQLLHML